jgi:integrase
MGKHSRVSPWLPEGHPKMKLDQKNITGLDLAGKRDAIYFDDTLPGFGYRMRAGAGGKTLRSWIVQYRQAGASRRLLIGSAEVLGAEAARSAARKALAQVALGQDPQGERQERRSKDRMSFRAVAEEHLAAKQTEVRAGTIRELKRYLVGPYFRSLHGMAIDRITRRDIAARLLGITRERSSITAARARNAISGLFAWAMRMGLTDSNPVIGAVQPADSKGRDRVLSDGELTAIWKSCGDDDYGRVIRLLILTACRRQEIGGMSWSELDPEHGTWTLPGERSKNHRQHALPLPAVAWDIINAVPHRVSRNYLFGSFGKKGFGGWVANKVRLDKRCGVTDWTVHDLRRGVATRMADIGIQPHIIEQILNHQSGHKRGPAGIYNRSSYEREVRAALALWADHIRSVVDGSERKILVLPSGAS